MYLRKIVNKKNGRIHLSIAHNYRDKNTKSSRTVIIKSLGYLDELEKIYDNPISYFTTEARKMELQRLADKTSGNFPLIRNEKLTSVIVNRRNFGYAALSKIYHELGLHTFFINRQRHLREEFETNTVMKQLVYSQLLYPASTTEVFEKRARFFENTDYTLDDVYRCLNFLNSHRNNLLLWLDNMIRQLYGRDTRVVYYHVTNYNFVTKRKDTSDYRDDSGEALPNPTIQLGLLMDNNGLPISYQLFPGNSDDFLTCRPNLSDIRKDYEPGRVVIVASKGLSTLDYIWHTIFGGNGYVFFLSPLDANNELRDYLLDQNGYEWLGEEYKKKSRLYSRSAQVTVTGGRRLIKTVNEKQIVCYFEELKKHAKRERSALLAKAWDIICNPQKYIQSTACGLSPYIKNISFDKKTGKILKTEKALELDLAKLLEEEKYDGYCIIVTSECKETDDRIIKFFRELPKIEEAFRVMESDPEDTPAYISGDAIIQAHFLTCFAALVIEKILEMKTKQKYSITRLLESLRKAECSHLQQNYYLFDYYDDVLEELGEKLGIDFSNKILSLREIKNYLGDTKK